MQDLRGVSVLGDEVGGVNVDEALGVFVDGEL